MSTCDDACVDNGIQFLNGIITQILIAAYPNIPPTFPPPYLIIEARLKEAFNTFQCNLPPDLVEKITKTLSMVNTAYIVVIFATFLLLVIFNYVAILVNSQPVTIGLFILSILVIIIAVAILYVWIQSIYSSAIETLNNAVKAGQEGLCCLAGTCNACICVSDL